MVNYRYPICSVVLAVLYRGIRVLSRVDSRVRQELNALPQGQVIRLRVSPAPKAPQLAFFPAQGTIHRAPEGTTPNIDIVFKNEKMAFRVFTGRMSIAGAYSAHAFTLRGNINLAMRVVRVLELAEGYLFPKLIARRLLKALPEKLYPKVLFYLRLIPGC